MRAREHGSAWLRPHTLATMTVRLLPRTVVTTHWWWSQDNTNTWRRTQCHARLDCLAPVIRWMKHSQVWHLMLVHIPLKQIRTKTILAYLLPANCLRSGAGMRALLLILHWPSWNQLLMFVMTGVAWKIITTHHTVCVVGKCHRARSDTLYEGTPPVDGG